ncbi:MAG: HigA family addiction module antidote protein [Acidimicrobiia bacterium]|nr:HigA family addiction module antidote protein [Acidimicrobiia bacterium]MYC57143.1 HigA family addiction module antidote protein [Acidimicrobiia bacterium]MYI29933.1 HigA family addiction module antidote protein [Acidimicrobiia bacterium]
MTMARIYTPAAVFSAGEYLRDELDERGWTVTEFAEIIGRPIQAVSEILNGKKEITTETAIAFSEAFGTTPELWLNLQTAYRLYEQRSDMSEEEFTPVARRARLRRVIPLTQVRSRGWISETDDLDETELAVCDLLEINNLDDRPQFAVAAKRSNSADPITIEQVAWLAYVRRVAVSQSVAAFDIEELRQLAENLPYIVKDGPGELPRLPTLLGECGVCLVFAEGLRGGKLDGAVTFLPDGCPVIALTTRHNRFDSLLFALLHECAHLTLGHINARSGSIIDDDLMGPQNDPDEVAANNQAISWLFPGGFDDWSTSVQTIGRAALKYNVHPSVVIGHIQFKTKKFSLYRNQIPKVRPVLQDAGLLL